MVGSRAAAGLGAAGDDDVPEGLCAGAGLGGEIAIGRDGEGAAAATDLAAGADSLALGALCATCFAAGRDGVAATRGAGLARGAAET